MAQIRVDGNTVIIEELEVEDPGLAQLLSAQPEDRREDVLLRALIVGARGLVSMGLGIDLAEVDDRVRRSIIEATAEARREVEVVLTNARTAFETQLSPEHRSSTVARTLAEFTAWRDSFLLRMDPAHADSDTARFLAELAALVGPTGELQQRLEEALDPTADNSAFAQFGKSIELRLTELRDAVMHQRGREEEAESGTQKGFDFEDSVQEWLRAAVAGPGGCVVERTGRTPGELSADAMVGDFVITLSDGARIVVEAKNAARINLAGKDGILDELDRAIVNRAADYSICISAREAFPKEVGPIGVYGHRLLVVEPGDGAMTAVAVRWAIAAMAAERQTRGELDHALFEDRLQRIRQLAQLLSGSRRSLTDITTSVENVRGTLEQLRTELLAVVTDLDREVTRITEPADVVRLRPAAG
ncbi:MAG: hypothetical protein P1T08_08525 [Acidimicrobiia bacterium]|nr:hypothetical protein [Acidimicrobiia bacterium]